MHRFKIDMMQPNFFDAGSPFLQHPLLTDERTGQEIDFIVKAIRLAPGASVLDVGCGFGRHSVELAGRGFGVTGIDPAAAMIQAAQRRAVDRRVKVDFHQVAAEAFQAGELFDAALCLLTTLGQISSKQENSRLVNRVHAILKPGGYFVVEVPQREAAVQNLKHSERFSDGEHETLITRTFDSKNCVVTETFCLVDLHETRKFLLQYRLFSRGEAANLLKEAGFSITAEYADYTGQPLTLQSPTMILIGRK